MQGDLPLRHAGLKEGLHCTQFPEVIVTRSRFSATGEEVFL